ncbi:polysaccharide biosynthesis/export family protein [Limnoglobus roseus]|uniref:Polysaccharide biosynthesis/export protein n=1 Tax=Limnoglobus roseus TaxID=2598579 RepID=A0A5C1APC4_9BACT|nr:polysaccharide biosynthesis/export family protein [Limnoglobus roseus]QEL20850.1 polysaccharide biosynthesis/export protein [Limnoglobus roseus]
MARRYSLACLLGLAVVCPWMTGCGSLGQSLGISSPRYKLIPQADEFREGNVPPPVLARELAKTPMAEYLVEPGDVLLIQPVELDSPIRIPADQPVLPDGSIEIGEYGRPIVTGKTTATIEQEVRSIIKAKEKKDIAVTVRLVGRQSKVYYVLGEVNSPGSYPLSGRETVLDGLMAAGGLSRQAQERKIILVRPTPSDGCREVMPVCYSQIVQLGDTTTNYQLRPGDRIFVPSVTTLESICPSRIKTPSCCKAQYPCARGGAAGCATNTCATLTPVDGPAVMIPPVPDVK